MIKELEKIMIEDVEYAYDPEKEYIKDDHAYCKVCHERKDGKTIPMLNKPMIFKMACRCDRDREAKEKERAKQMEIERLKAALIPLSSGHIPLKIIREKKIKALLSLKTL